MSELHFDSWDFSYEHNKWGHRDDAGSENAHNYKCPVGSGSDSNDNGCQGQRAPGAGYSVSVSTRAQFGPHAHSGDGVSLKRRASPLCACGPNYVGENCDACPFNAFALHRTGAPGLRAGASHCHCYPGYAPGAPRALTPASAPGVCGGSTRLFQVVKIFG